MRITNLKDVRAAVWAGIGFLDSQCRDWRDKINLRKLDLKQADKCVLGEVYGTYLKGRRLLDLSEEQAKALGFNLPPVNSVEDRIAGFARLTAEWRAAYRAGQRKARVRA